MGDVITFPGVTRLDLIANRVIEKASGAKLKDIVIIGFDEDEEFYFASNKADGGEVL